MSKWIKKQIVVDAFKWTAGPDQTEDPEWIVDRIKDGSVVFKNEGTPDVKMVLPTNHGPVSALTGDYIIKTSNGELYPCTEEVFLKNYDRV